MANDNNRKGPPPRRERQLPEAFPDYTKTITSQMQSSPEASGALRGLGTGAASAVLAALAAKVLDADDKQTALATLVSGLVGGGVGAYSGYNDRESENSRVRYLGRMGVSGPGELEIMSKYPEMSAYMAAENAAQLTRRHNRKHHDDGEKTAGAMTKEAGPGAWMALRMLLGGAAGGAWGQYGAPKTFGYDDNQHSKNMSTFLNAAEGAALLANPGMLMNSIRTNPKMLPMLAGATATAEFLPLGHNMLTKTTNTMANLDKPTMSQQIMSALKSPEARGAGAGAALAGLLALATGSVRARTEGELAANSGRAGMAVNDFMTYALPVMAAGGLAGNMLKASGHEPPAP
jgi:hypothetical protein